MSDNSFQQHSISTARRFLQTVVVVDDQAYFGEDIVDRGATPTEEEVVPNEIVVPDPLKMKPQSILSGDSSRTSVSEYTANSVSEQSRTSQHSLNAKEMGDSFADRGLVCSILRPELQGETREKVIRRTMIAAQRADVLVLDWQISNEEQTGVKRGQLTRDIILNVLRKDSGQLRLIAVYTAEPRVGLIVNSIEQHLKDNGFEPKRIGDDTYTLQMNHARVEVYCKEAAAAEPRERRVTIEDLPDRLIASFSNMTGGLVSNFAVDAISAIRENTYHLLSRLHKDLSGPYLVQRVLTQPEDAFELLVNLVGSEIHSLISEHSIDEDHEKAIAAWLDQEGDLLGDGLSYEEESRQYTAKVAYLRKLVAEQPEDTDFVDLKNITKKLNPRTVPAETLRDWAIKGVIPENKKFDKERLYKKIPTLFCRGEPQHSIAEFATLTTTRTRYGDRQAAPILTLGTIIEDSQENADARFLLCIQPRCDSVRLKKEHPNPFLFLALKSSKLEEPFDFVIRRNDSEIVYLSVDQRASRWRILPFAPNVPESGAVRATKKSEYFIFTSEGAKNAFKWVAELKEGYAQRISNQFASHVSRVGLNEMEWLRLSAKNRQE